MYDERSLNPTSGPIAESFRVIRGLTCSRIVGLFSFPGKKRDVGPSVKK